MKRVGFGAPAILAAIAFGALACGQPLTTADQTQTAQAVAASPSATLGVDTATAVAATGTPTAATATPVPGLTDTGYKAPDGSPLYAECIGPDPVSGRTLPLPPVFPEPAGSPAAPPTPATTPEPQSRPPDADLPAFDVLGVQPTNTATWRRVSTTCLGGLSFAVPDGWTVIHDFAVGGYQQAASAMYVSADGSAKIDLVYSYSPIDRLAVAAASPPGQGSYALASHVAVTIGGAPGLLDVSSDILDSSTRYITAGYLVSPQPNWYLSVSAFFRKPYSQQSFADLFGLVSSTRFQP